jgi:hypothetical protein
VRAFGACVARARARVRAARPSLTPTSSFLGKASTTRRRQIDLACTDVVVAGTLHVYERRPRQRAPHHDPAGGTIDGGSGVIQLGGNWSNSGAFTRELDGRIQRLCAITSATIGGNTTFFNASFVSSTGKNYVFAVGTTQTIGALLEIAGPRPIRSSFRSGTPGQVANVNLAAATQQIQHVGVTDVWATGQHLAPNLTNEGGGGNAFRWFGSASPPTCDRSRRSAISRRSRSPRCSPAFASSICAVADIRARHSASRLTTRNRNEPHTLSRNGPSRSRSPARSPSRAHRVSARTSRCARRPRGNFAVRDSTGSILRLLVNGTTGEVTIPYLTGAPQYTLPVCFQTGTGLWTVRHRCVHGTDGATGATGATGPTGPPALPGRRHRRNGRNGPIVRRVRSARRA